MKRLHVIDLPFDSIWVEFNQNVRVDYQYEVGTSIERRMEDLGSVGYLIRKMDKNISNEWESYEFATATKDAMFMDDMAMSVVQQEISSTDNSLVRWPSAGRNKKFVATGWGYSGSRFDVNSKEIESLLQYGRTRPDIVLVPSLIEHYKDNAKQVRSIADITADAALEARGDLRFLVTLVAMLNLFPEIEYVHKPVTGKFLYGSKSISYLDTNVVTLHVGKKKIVNLVKSREKNYIGMRRHEVRGHYRVLYRGTPNERIIHVKNFWRGDESLGFVKKEIRLDE